MKKAKIITISLFGLLILVPFMTPTRAQPPSYVGIAQEEEYTWDVNVYDTNWDQWFADNMTNWLASIFSHDSGSTLTQIWTDTLSWDPTPPQLIFNYTIDLILPENTTSGQTQVTMTQAIEVPGLPAMNSIGPLTVYIGNDTANFAELSLYGGMATSAYWIPGVPFAPINVNWTEFTGWAQWGLGPTGYWGGGYVENTIVTALTNGYSMSVPINGYVNNSMPIRINVTYDANGVLSYNSFEYGNSKLYDYVFSSYDPDTVNPVITAAASDFSVEHDYTGETISWTATDMNPDTYTITRSGTGVVSETAWISGTEVQYSVPDGLTEGNHAFGITFTDDEGNSVTDTVIMTVGAAPAAAIPGYELPIVLDVFIIATIGLIVIRKKKNK